MLKKIGLLLICVCLIFMFTACSKDAVDTGAGVNSGTASTLESNAEVTSSDTSSTESSASSEESKPSGNKSGAFTVSGQTLEIGMNLTENVVTKLGDAIDIQSAPSCHFDGEDTIYVYDNYSLYTYADGDKDVLYLIEISAEGVTTADGIGIGSTYDDVKKAYGEPDDESATSLCYETSTALLRITHDGTVVELIEYEEK